jgi:hypothetical protein
MDIRTSDLRTAPAPVRPSRRVTVPLVLGASATVLTAIGLSGVGDAPDPKAPATDISQHFLEQRDAVLAAAPFAHLGAIAVVLLAVHLARRVGAAGSPGAAVTVTAGGALVAAYLVGAQVVYTTLAYEAADTSADVSKALFVGTVLAAPILGAGVAALLGGLAWGDRRGEVVPRWLVVTSALGAAVASLALVSFAQRDLFSPDIAQQVSGNIIVLWPILAGGATAWRSRRA